MKQSAKSTTDDGIRTAVLEAASATPGGTKPEDRSAEDGSAVESAHGVRLSPTLEDATDRYRLVRPTIEL